MGWFRFRSREGVCDTPLHLFGWNQCFVGLRIGFVFAHMRAYAIRPYTYSMGIMAFSGEYIISFLLIPDDVSFRYTAVLYTTKWGIESLSTPFLSM